MNVLEVWVNAGQQRRAVTAFSVCKVRKVHKGWEEQSICFSWESQCNPPHFPFPPRTLSSAWLGPRRSAGDDGWTFLDATGGAIKVRYSDKSGTLQAGTQPPCKPLLLISLQTSIHSPGSNGHKKTPGGHEACTIAHAWSCASKNKEQSVCNSRSVSGHLPFTALTETGFSAKTRLWQGKQRWDHGELGLREQPWAGLP